MSDKNLLPCPFCGERALIVSEKTDLSDIRIECSECLIHVKYSDCINSAIEIYNSRVAQEINKLKSR